MKALVSLCNKMPWDPHPGVFLVEVVKRSSKVDPFTFRPIVIEDKRIAGHGGFTGLAKSRGGIYLLTQSAPAHLVLLNSRYRVKRVWDLHQVSDAHSLIVRDGNAYVVSTGNDSIVEVNLRSGREHVVWKHGKGDDDTIHVNSLMSRGGRLLATMFGHKQGNWKSAKDGMVYDLAAGRVYCAPIYHPHSLCRVVHPSWNYAYWRNLFRRPKKKYYYCESWSRSVCTNKGDRLEVGKGYTRGLAVTDEYMFVGLSQSRKKSKSTGEENLADPTWAESISGVCVYRLNFDRFSASQLVSTIPLSDFGNEVYDILPLPS